MNNRQQALLLALLEQMTYQTTKALAESFSVSERTLQTDLNRIEEYLAAQPLQVQLERKKGTGVRIEGHDSQRARLKKKVNQGLNQSSFDEEKRTELLIFHLLMAKKGQSLDELAEKMFVSRMEIKRLLEALHAFFSYNGLSLVSKPRIGTLVEGPERKKRELLAQNLKAIQKSDPQTMMLKDFFSKETLSLIQRILREVLTKEGVGYNPELSNVDIHIYFMLERMWQGETVLLSEEEHQLVENTLAQKLSSCVLVKLSDVYPVVFSPNEIDYLALRLAHVISKEQGERQSLEKAQALTIHLIKGVEQLMCVDFQQDPTLEANLMSHLSSTYFRINHGFSISNPLTKEILGTYTHLFLVIQMVLESFFSEEDFYIPQEEIAYLTVHFQAAFERTQKPKQKRFEAILVSQYSQSMATFLEARLNRELPDLTIKKTIEYLDGMSADFGSADFIVSTVPLDNATLPVVVISPMITESDVAQLLKYMLEHQPIKTKKQFDLARFTNPFLVFPQLDFANVSNLLHFLGEHLVNEGYVASSFVASLIDRESRSSTRVAPFIALPHGNPDLVKLSTISIATLREPMDWHGEKVQLVLLLAVRQEELKDEQFKRLFPLIHYLESNHTVLNHLLSEKNPLNLIQLLSEYE